MCSPPKCLRPWLFAATAPPLPQRNLGLRLNSHPADSGKQKQRKRRHPIYKY